MAVLKRHILFVDDDPLARRLVESMLQQAGYIVNSVEDGFAALELLEKNAFDLIILDVMMAKMNGLDLLKRLRTQETTRSVPVMMLSSRDDQKVISRALQLGASDYLIKPPDRTLLLRKIENILGGRPRFSEVYLDQESTRAASRMLVETRILSVGETGITLRVPYALPVGSQCVFQAPLFDELGLGQPRLRVAHCQEDKSGIVLYLDFTSLRASEVRKVRDWVVSMALRGRTVA